MRRWLFFVARYCGTICKVVLLGSEERCPSHPESGERVDRGSDPPSKARVSDDSGAIGSIRQRQPGIHFGD